MKTNRTRIPLFILLLLSCSLLMKPLSIEAFSDQIIQRGATGDDVVELQSRLQYIGFFNGKIDGVYGWSTYWAVRNYQHEFGLEVDGLVGPKMKEMLERSTDFDYEWVHRQFHEGRRFTHYGTTPKEIQSGPKGSKKPPLVKKKKQQKETRKRQETPQQSGEQAPGGKGTPGGPGAPTPGTPTPGGATGTPTPGEQVPEQAPGTTPEQIPGTTPEQTPETQPVPEEEPIPEEEAIEGDEPTIEKAINVPQGFTDNDIQLMAQAVYGEARGEPYIGQVAVAAVILNRLNSPTFPNTVSGVIFEPRAFTAVADGQIWLEPNETARRAVLDAINGQDPSGNAMYYFNPDTATSGWIWSRPQIKRIGKHIFCK